MRCLLLYFGVSCLLRGIDGISLRDRVALYENCEIFNVTHVYGGMICGDDGQTYANSLFLDCLNYHSSKTVATLHVGPCLPHDELCTVDLYYDPVCGSDHITYTNERSLECTARKHARQLTVTASGPCESDDYCYRGGTAIYGTNPVCGNTGFTYQNPAQVKCLQRYNEELHILHDGGCLVDEVRSLYNESEPICTLAKTRYEWNPLCASDGFTYPNPFVFLCYHSDLGVISNGECDTISHDSCVEAYADTGVSGRAEQTNRLYSLDDEVCGSDGRTYASVHHLYCQTRHNKYLFMRHEGACSGPDDNPCGSIPEEDHRMPVCGSDGRSYVSPEALWCANARSPETKLVYMHDGPC